MNSRRHEAQEMLNTVQQLRFEIDSLIAGIEELIEFEDPERRDLTIADITLNETVTYVNLANWRIYEATRGDSGDFVHGESPFRTWSREIVHLHPVNRDPRAFAIYPPIAATQTSGTVTHESPPARPREDPSVAGRRLREYLAQFSVEVAQEHSDSDYEYEYEEDHDLFGSDDE